MRPNDRSRVQKEIKDILKDTASGVTVELREENSIQEMIGSLSGPKDTPYEGGLFYVDIKLDDQYPFAPPKMKFITKVWHPNISSASGAICLDVLKDQWSPALTIKTAMLSLQALLSTPEPNDPQDAVVAKQYLTDKASFDQTAKQWTEMYAHRDQLVGMKGRASELVEMGFSEERVLEALAAAGGDKVKALEELLK
mmetsp:Transcript_14524/g.41367  ORF Transcript_14524/g.41367 Transcript_14524/m.41367 type:complete len:197 (-) Transcript_14524:106-696(-)|eukprot:CAMPEP_0182610672 /NCGR_PEP_ID=MMETSP1330-20130603/9634_1 /TAXON_ID=464278 /ORGANISM="Picochlorum sp., Strain RCC944" /LENGTH=196 /DNA_ID=CAMNT_0024829915 /DNA_START=113 /DNA_END=703 /DNA_ORIENTATION=-